MMKVQIEWKNKRFNEKVQRSTFSYCGSKDNIKVNGIKLMRNINKNARLGVPFDLTTKCIEKFPLSI
jgi:hypothetical protein